VFSVENYWEDVCQSRRFLPVYRLILESPNCRYQDSYLQGLHRTWATRVPPQRPTTTEWHLTA